MYVNLKHNVDSYAHCSNLKKSSRWKWHTLIPQISVCISTSLYTHQRCKIGHYRQSLLTFIFKLSPWGQIQVKVVKFKHFCTYFSLICKFFLLCRHILVILTILALPVCKLIDLVGFVVCNFHWELFLILNSVFFQGCN